MSDAELKRAVTDELNWEPSIDAAHIGVAAKDGVVTLTGKVGSYFEKHNAEKAAGRVHGVKGIAEELVVESTSSMKTDDEGIAEQAVQVLEWDVSVPSSVKAVVEEGWVTLSGEVNWFYQRDAAETDVRRLRGVLGVTNNVTIKPSVKANVVKDKIRAAFERNAQIEANDINVATDGGRVTLTGIVDSWYERELSETTAWSAPGVSDVDNQLIVE